MSLQSLYTISEFNVKGNEFSAIITFDPSHEIFSGHFPEQPIVPGVCLIHIIKDIAIRIAEHEVVLSNGNNIKFLNVIDPRKHANVHIKGSFSFNESRSLSINANIFNDDVIFFKFKGLFNTETLKH